MTQPKLERKVIHQQKEIKKLKKRLDKFLKPEMKVKVGIINWCSLAISITAVVLGIISICNKYPRTDIEVDYWGIIIGVLALLVTVLVGFQIFQIVNFDKEKEKFANQINEEYEQKTIEIKKIESRVNDVYKDIKTIHEELKHKTEVTLRDYTKD